jgi:phosphoribosylglycinamide formyltransferase-1
VRRQGPAYNAARDDARDPGREAPSLLSIKPKMTRESKSIVCLISGRGSNLEAILRSPAFALRAAAPGAEAGAIHVAAVISNQPDVRGLEVARSHGVPTVVLPHASFPSRQAFEAALAQAIDAHRPALIVLAGFMRVLTPAFVTRYRGRLLNIHPSLLPAFAGLDTHRRALAAGVRLHGATVHFVSDQLDAGPIVAQTAVPVWPDDSEDALASRVLEQEHLLLPRCIGWILEGRVRLDGERVVTQGIEPQELLVFARESAR